MKYLDYLHLYNGLPNTKIFCRVISEGKSLGWKLSSSEMKVYFCIYIFSPVSEMTPVFLAFQLPLLSQQKEIFIFDQIFYEQIWNTAPVFVFLGFRPSQFFLECLPLSRLFILLLAGSDTIFSRSSLEIPFFPLFSGASFLNPPRLLSPQYLIVVKITRSQNDDLWRAPRLTAFINPPAVSSPFVFSAKPRDTLSSVRPLRIPF